MTTKTQASMRGLRKSLRELADVCPVEECNPRDCPLSEVRKLKPAARLRWINDLSEADLRFLATYHHVCMNIMILEHPVDE